MQVKVSCEAQKRQKRITRESLQNLIRSIKIIWHRSRSSGRSKKRTTYIRTVFPMKSWSLKRISGIKDRKHEAFSYKYHLIDNLRLSKFTFMEQELRSGRITNIRLRKFLLQNGLYIALSLYFHALCVLSRRSRRELLF